MKTPKDYLSKRENETYCIISDGMPVNMYMSKEDCLKVADKFNMILPDQIWSAKIGDWITE